MRRALLLAPVLLLAAGTAGAEPPSSMTNQDLHFQPVPVPSGSAIPVIHDNIKTGSKESAFPPHSIAVPSPSIGREVRNTHTQYRNHIVGVATWYCEPGVSVCTNGFSSSGAYGAAGPALRAALGSHWRGRTVWVNGIAVKLIDWCACGGNHVIDVYHSTWLKIPHPSSAIVSW